LPAAFELMRELAATYSSSFEKLLLPVLQQGTVIKWLGRGLGKKPFGGR
jgi:hypothetical protein